MIPKTLSEIAPADIHALAGSDLREGRTIDYKIELPGETGDDKREFLADISSFANTSGGDIVYGIREVDGIPSEIRGIAAGTDLDAAILRMDSIIASGIQPRVRHAIHIVPTAPSPVIVIRIEKSHIGPHRVIYRSHDKFYARSSAGKYPLDVVELRDAFLRSSSISANIRDFRMSRIASIRAGDTPVPTSIGARLVIHLIPLQAFGADSEYEMNQFYRNPSQVHPIYASKYDYRPNLEGLVIYSAPSSASQQKVNYTQLYRSGIIEAVDSNVFHSQNGRPTIDLKRVEQTVLEYVPRYFGNQAVLGVAPPVYIFVSLLDAKGTYPYVGDQVASYCDRCSQLDRDCLLLPEASILDFNTNLSYVMKPAFDMMWNSFGFQESTSYSSDGAYL